ncbi:MAG: hypothetical protein J5787_09345 [Alphaproteobacteria bacterium]|nr:hypothetical protein [Alphaproteobacteria bacterium]
MSADLEMKRSVAIDEEHENTLRAITQNDNPKAPFEHFYSAITFAAVLGFSQGHTPKPNSKHIKMDAIKPEYFSRCDGGYIALLIALLHTKSYDKILNEIPEDSDYVSIFTGYANAGLEIIEDWRTQYNGDIMNTTEIILQGLQNVLGSNRANKKAADAGEVTVRL